LGLTICRRYVELLGGSISVESEPGNGSCFSIVLPREQDIANWNKPDTAVESHLSRSEIPKAAKEIQVRILLVDDDDVSHFLIKHMLAGKAGLDSALTGEEALHLLSVNQYDLVLLDINLRKGIGGLDVLTEARKIEHCQTYPLWLLQLFPCWEIRNIFWLWVALIICPNPSLLKT